MADDGNLYAYIGIPVIFLLGFAGSLTTMLISWKFPKVKLEDNNVFVFFTCIYVFACGLILSVGIMHAIPDSFEQFQENLTDDTPVDEYPWGALICMAGMLLTYLSEQIVEWNSSTELGKHSHSPSTSIADNKSAANASSKHEDSESSVFLANHTANQAVVNYYSEMLVLFFGLLFHNIFIGINLGLNGTDYALFAALVFHQYFEGLALGARVDRVKLRKRFHAVLIDFCFAIAASVGMAIGLGVKSSIEDDPFAYGITSGVFQALSSGILTYIALVHMLCDVSPTLDSTQLHSASPIKSIKRALSSYTGLLLGASIMSVIGIWA